MLAMRQNIDSRTWNSPISPRKSWQTSFNSWAWEDESSSRTLILFRSSKWRPALSRASEAILQSPLSHLQATKIEREKWREECWRDRGSGGIMTGYNIPLRNSMTQLSFPLPHRWDQAPGGQCIATVAFYTILPYLSNMKYMMCDNSVNWWYELVRGCLPDETRNKMSRVA